MRCPVLDQGFYTAEAETAAPCCGEKRSETGVIAIYLIYVPDHNGKMRKIKYRVSGNW
jgi:hypothetical protein